jgi:glycolate oxidase FAD binding subunit
MVTPGSAAEVAALLAEGEPVQPIGGGTKVGWGRPVQRGLAPLATAGNEGKRGLTPFSTLGLGEIVEHNEGDLTAVLQAGVRLADAQARFAKAGQRLALDPFDGGATIGGVVATGDSGPLRHRFGSIRDLILGVQVALPDGTVARAGSRVIKNVAGYDLAKLMCGSLGTLGVVCEVTVRLHPQPAEHATAVGRGDDPDTLAAAGRALARRPLELEALDLRWEDGAGAVLAGAAGHAAGDQASAAADALREAGLDVDVVEDDAELWEAQRAAQRAAPPDADREAPPEADRSAVVRVSALPVRLAEILRAGRLAVARAGAGLAWVHVPADAEAIAALRARLAPAPCVLLDAPEELRGAVDPWGMPDGPELALMRRVKERFDPAGVINRGRYVGGI